MNQKTNNNNYDVLDKILAESDRAERQQQGRRAGGQGLPVLSKEEFDALSKTVDDLEKYLRS